MKLLGRGGLGCLFGVVLGALAPSAARADLIFVTNAGSNTIGEYTTAGATVNAALVTGLSNPFGIAVAPAAAGPEPGTLALLGAGLAGLTFCRRRRAG